jgi:predicted CDP-diglyceride synthetase/phosphatidate cytidylyltransferase
MRLMHLYALLTLASFTWISIKYKQAFIYFLPFSIAFFVWFYVLTTQKDSFVSNPEKIYNNKPFLVFCMISFALLVVLGIYG